MFEIVSCTNHFVDCINDDESPGSSQATFHRGNSQSCIDYIFASSDIAADRGPGKVTYVQPAWTDHFLLSTSFRLRPITSSGNAETPQDMGKGLWRAHPRLASDPEFCDSLAVALSETVAGFDNSMFATLKWEDLKLTTARVAKSFSRRKAFIMAKAEECLQRKRRRILKNMKKNPANIDDLQPQLKVIDEQLSSYQQFHVETLALRSGLRWRELGELSAGYLKRTVATRSIKQRVPPLIHPETQVICNTKNKMLDAASTFYSSLYSSEPVDQSAIDDLLGALPDSLTLSTTAQSLMTAPLTFDDIVVGVSRSPRRSSPGSDGLPYEILSLIVNHADCRDIVLAVYNDALCYGVFPSSWKETCVSILPKKGNLADLKNWRPISLINTDSKAYTLWLHAPPIYCRQWFSHAQKSGSTAIGLLLDQEKAYDRVHPDYLRQVLHKFEFPSKVVDSLMSLFLGTSLRLNINGFLSDPVSQLRGLRQGDPISPILFNLAFEPLLRKILLGTSFKGFSLPLSTLAHPQDENLQAVKLLAYADDVLCLLHDPGDLRVLQSHLALYSRASNAKVNFHKTQVLSLSGSPLIYSSVWRNPLLNHNISHRHDCRSLEPLIYLGFPLCSSPAQRNFFLNNLLHKIRISCNLHSQRSLSIRGRVTILNSFILSKLWHVLRLTSAPLSFFDKVKSLMPSFFTFRMFPKISLSSMCRPRSLGSLGVLDPVIHQGALQLRWIIPLLSDCVTGPLSTFWVSPVLNRASIILPRLTKFLLHHPSSFPVLTPLSNLGLPFDHRLSLL
ncbi:hypothetical protein G6F61_011957 [Rhizopus arrhizus]|nr:hypothetical protein G6F61_011957 [Rhizopus arrhizus]